MDVEAEHGQDAAAGTSTMPSVSSQLSALCDKIGKLSAPGTDSAARKVAEACICMAICNLGNAASPELARMTAPLSDASQFEDTGESWLGAHGTVSKVRRRRTGKAFAMKGLYYRPGGGGEEEEEEEARDARLVLREACFMAACRGHPSLVRFYGVARYPVQARYCLVMEHVGPNLHHVLANLRRGEPFQEPDARRVVRQVLGGARAMHDRGVVHRAIHPRNVLVCNLGNTVKIGDFGEAASVSETNAPYTTRSAYLPPEELLALAASGAGGNNVAIDSWSIGCLMAELLTGKPLFEVPADKDQRRQQLYKIFRVFGVPGKRTSRAIKVRDSALAGEVEQWRACQRFRAGKQQRGSNRNHQLRELIPGDVLSDDGFEVLKGLLKCNPNKRLTAAAALQLPWFTDNDDPPASADLALQVSSMATVADEKPRPPITCLLIGMLHLLLFVISICIFARRSWQ